MPLSTTELDRIHTYLDLKIKQREDKLVALKDSWPYPSIQEEIEEEERLLTKDTVLMELLAAYKK